MSAPEWDFGSIAVEIADMLTELDEMHGADGGGWTFNGLDIGEVEVTAPDGLMFRLTVEQVKGFDQ